MASRTSRFGFLTFDSEQDDLSAMDYKAFVADREAMDRLLRVACEAHTHTGETVSDIPAEPPVLQLQTILGSLPPNQPIYYKVSVVDIYGQERIASTAAVVFGPPQMLTPDAPTLAADTAGVLMPGDYQYAISAWVGDTSSETAISKIVTGSLRGQGAWIITPPNPPSGAQGWNLYRKGPTETGFQRVLTINNLDTRFHDDGTVPRRDQRAPDENTTFITNAVLVSLPTPLEAGQTARVYRTFDSADWDHSLVEWTATMPYLDIGSLSMAGYPPDVSAGVGGAPKIRIGIDTEGHLPGALLTPMQTTVFNVRGALEVGFWPWQWINELDTFHLLGMRANLGRDSVPDSQPVRVVLERRAYGEASWYRIVDPFEASYYAEIAAGATIGSTVMFSPDAAVDLELRPGDALRMAIAQTGGGAQTDRDLTLTVLAAAQHGSPDGGGWTPTYALAFLMPAGAAAGSTSEYIDVTDAVTELTAISWERNVADGNGFEIQDEMNNTTYLVKPTSVDGTMSPTDYPQIKGPTRLRIKTLDALGSFANITLRLLGEGTSIESDAPWVTLYSYTLETAWELFEHSPGSFQQSTNKRALLDIPAIVSGQPVPEQVGARLTAITLEKDVQSDFRGTLQVMFRNGAGATPDTFCLRQMFSCTGTDTTIWTGPPVVPRTEVWPGPALTIDVWEMSTGESIAPPMPQLRVTLHFEDGAAQPPGDWRGMPGFGSPWEEHPL